MISNPLKLVLSVSLIWKLIGWPCLMGALTVLVAQIINIFLTRALLRWERTRRTATDTKLQKITQYVVAIRYLRLTAWQDFWQDGITEARQRELNLRVITNLLGIIIGFTNNASCGMFPVVAFWAYVSLAGKPLRVDVAFPALQLFSMLESSLREVPRLITVLLNANIAVGRIEDFMHEPDKEDSNDRGMKPSSGQILDQSRGNTLALDPNGNQLTLDNASFAWPGSRIVLRNISIVCPVGVTLICGKVGAGKTALLQAMLGELDMQGGVYLRSRGVVAYCSQIPWLQSMSIRENILFFSPFDGARYRQVLEACALTQDLSAFKHGDSSDIGENGIGLSGGQRMRVALARAVYSHAKILLLDDPLSALDLQTAATIVQNCFAGPLLKDRTVVMTTHRPELCCKAAKQIVEISEGKVLASGPTLSEVVNQTRSAGPVDKGEGTNSKDQDPSIIPEKFLGEEHRARGGVKAAVYWEYIKAGKLRWWAVLVCVLAVYRLLAVGETWYLKQWGEAYSDRSHDYTARTSASHRLFDTLPSPETNPEPWLYGFLLFAIAQAIMFLITQGFMLVIIYSAGRQMFQAILCSISRVTFRFYDITPLGRLMNRMTSDISTIDGNISQQFQDVAWQAITWISSVVVIGSVTPVFLVLSLALTAAFVLLFLRFLPTSQSLRRLEVRGHGSR